MTEENTKTPREIEEELEASREKSDALGKAIDAADEKPPAKPDHADDGGVF
jgi:hypothetical protein